MQSGLHVGPDLVTYMQLKSHPQGDTGRGDKPAACTRCRQPAGGRATLTFYRQTAITGLPICPACYAVLCDKAWINGLRFDR